MELRRSVSWWFCPPWAYVDVRAREWRSGPDTQHPPHGTPPRAPPRRRRQQTTRTPPPDRPPRPEQGRPPTPTAPAPPRTPAKTAQRTPRPPRPPPAPSRSVVSRGPHNGIGSACGRLFWGCRRREGARVLLVIPLGRGPLVSVFCFGLSGVLSNGGVPRGGGRG